MHDHTVWGKDKPYWGKKIKTRKRKKKIMNNLKLTGKITHILEKQIGEGKNGTWVKQGFVIEGDTKFPRSVSFDIFGVDKQQSFEKSQSVGDIIEVYFDIESREYNGKWYTNLQVWKWETKTSVSTPENTPIGEGVEPDDLPF